MKNKSWNQNKKQQCANGKTFPPLSIEDGEGKG